MGGGRLEGKNAIITGAAGYVNHFHCDTKSISISIRRNNHCHHLQRCLTVSFDVLVTFACVRRQNVRNVPSLPSLVGFELEPSSAVPMYSLCTTLLLLCCWKTKKVLETAALALRQPYSSPAKEHRSSWLTFPSSHWSKLSTKFAS